MTRSQWIERAASRSGLSRRSLTEACEALEAVLLETLLSGESVQISGFGSFTVRHVEAHTGRDPRTNRTLELPATRRITFQPGKTLKEKIKHET